MKHIFIILIAIFLHFNSFAQIFGTSKFSAYVFVAPENTLKGVKKVTVSKFSGNSALGQKISDYMAADLILQYRGAGDKDKIFMKGAYTNIYAVVERNRLNAILKEQRRNMSGIIDEGTAVEAGKLLGIDAMIVGSISYTSRDVKDKKSYKHKRKDGSIYYTYKYTLKRIVNTEASMKIISIKTGKVLGQTNSSTRDYDSRQNEKGYPSSSSLQSSFDLAENGAKTLAHTFVDYFTPYFKNWAFYIKKVKVKEYKKNAKIANSALKNGEINKAFNIYDAIYKEDPYNSNVAYNLGVINEIMGDFNNAHTCYSTAYELAPSDKDFSNAKKRAQKGKELLKNLKEVGISLNKPQFGSSAGGSNVNYLAKKVKTKGSKSKRYNVFMKPDESAEVVAKIPGNTIFTIIKTEGKWYNIKLLGDKNGYINKKNIREE